MVIITINKVILKTNDYLTMAFCSKDFGMIKQVHQWAVQNISGKNCENFSRAVYSTLSATNPQNRHPHNYKFYTEKKKSELAK